MRERVVPTKGNIQVPISPFLGIPRFYIPPNEYSLLSTLDECLADGGLLVARLCQNIWWWADTLYSCCIQTCIGKHFKFCFKLSTILVPFSLGISAWFKTMKGCYGTMLYQLRPNVSICKFFTNLQWNVFQILFWLWCMHKHQIC